MGVIRREVRLLLRRCDGFITDIHKTCILFDDNIWEPCSWREIVICKYVVILDLSWLDVINKQTLTIPLIELARHTRWRARPFLLVLLAFKLIVMGMNSEQLWFEWEHVLAFIRLGLRLHGHSSLTSVRDRVDDTPRLPLGSKWKRRLRGSLGEELARTARGPALSI